MFSMAVIATLRALQDSNFPEKPEDDATMMWFLGLLFVGLIISFVASAYLRKREKALLDRPDCESDFDSLLEADQADVDLSGARAPLIHPEELEEMIRYCPEKRDEFVRELKELRKRTMPSVELANGD